MIGESVCKFCSVVAGCTDIVGMLPPLGASFANSIDGKCGVEAVAGVVGLRLRILVHEKADLFFALFDVMVRITRFVTVELCCSL